jgi:hypothetical protein
MNPPALARQTFKTARLAEFCSRRELVNQTGDAVERVTMHDKGRCIPQGSPQRLLSREPTLKLGRVGYA